MAHMRSKSFHCTLCHGDGKIVANLDSGKLESHALPEACHWPGMCKERTARGIFDRQFGADIIMPSYPEPK
jgi:hypothetical protein